LRINARSRDDSAAFSKVLTASLTASSCVQESADAAD
jgi:hypothetical protein